MAKRVLVVDDERGVREALRQLLEYEEIDVRTAESGMEALKLYAEFHPHLVFLDVKMAGLDGLETDVTRYTSGCRAGGAAELWTINGGGTVRRCPTTSAGWWSSGSWRTPSPRLAARGESPALHRERPCAGRSRKCLRPRRAGSQPEL